jgi:hypothetical protein
VGLVALKKLISPAALPLAVAINYSDDKWRICFNPSVLIAKMFFKRLFQGWSLFSP